VTGKWTAPDYVDAYRYYYANEKRDLFEWSKDRTEPPWLKRSTRSKTTPSTRAVSD